MNPNLTWSPDGRKVALSTKTKGVDELAIIDYKSGEIEKIRLKELDAIGSVSWSPDGKKISFDGNIGPFQDIFVYDFDEASLTNITGDLFTDAEPYWDNDSRHIYFISERADKKELHTYTFEHRLLEDESIYQKDIFRVAIDSDTVQRITTTPGWTERQPQITRTGRLIYQTDRNGIQNIYEHDFESGESFPLTDLQAGISQLSVSADGSRIAFSSINEGYLDIFLLKTPFLRKRILSLPKIIGHFGELLNLDQVEFQQHILLKSYLNMELFLELIELKKKKKRKKKMVRSLKNLIMKVR